MVAERAIKQMPGSYKLWILYLRLLVDQCNDRCISDPQFGAVNSTFERALCFLQKMPVVWQLYVDFIARQKLILRFREVFERALRALPITQHELLWPRAIEFIKIAGVPSSLGCDFFQRYTSLQPEFLESRVKYLKSVHKLNEAAIVLEQIVNDEDFVSKSGKSKEKLWNEFCSLICKNPEKVTSLNIDAIIRSAIVKYNDEVGNLWTSLADYYLRILQFEKTRDVYEEGISSVKTVRDFEYVFNTYCQFCEVLIRSKLDGETESSSELDFEADDVDLLMARYENLLERRPLLLNSVLLRQNPNNVSYWLRRASIYKKMGKPVNVLETYALAIKTIDIPKAVGRLHLLWVKLAKFYEQNSKDLKNVRKTYERAVLYPFRKVDDLATVWCEWVEAEIRHGNHQAALSVVRQATTIPYTKARFEETGATGSAQSRVFRSTKLWALHADLEEALGTFETVCAVYETIFDLRVATVNLVLNFASFLTERRYFEKAFRALERGVALFRFPHVVPLWERYLDVFLARYGGSKLERTRELFEHAIRDISAARAKPFFLRYAEFEEQHGTPKNVVALYGRMCKALEGKEKNDMFLVYLSKTAKLFGAIKTREVFEEAIEVLADAFVPAMCTQYAALEIKLGEVDRARAIYQYGSKFADTRIFGEFWEDFERFEADFGNIETFADMNRLKRSVAAAFTNFLVSAGESEKPSRAQQSDAEGTMEQMEEKALKRRLEEDDDSNEIDLEQDGPEEVRPKAIGAMDRLKRQAVVQ